MMKVRRLELDGRNTGLLKLAHIANSCKEDCGYVRIRRGGFSRCGNTSPLLGTSDKYYQRNRYLRYQRKIIYSFNEFGNKEKARPVFVAFNWFQHQRFLWIQREHWLQKEENIRYVVNLVFLLIGVYLGLKGLNR